MVDKNFDKSFLLMILLCQVMFACTNWQVVILYLLPVDVLARYFSDVSTYNLLTNNGIAATEPDFSYTLGRSVPVLSVMAAGVYI